MAVPTATSQPVQNEFGKKLFWTRLIGNGVLRSLHNEINALLNLREVFGWSQILVLADFFRLIGGVKGKAGCSVDGYFILKARRVQLEQVSKPEIPSVMSAVAVACADG